MKKQKILLVEDEKNLLSSMCEALKDDYDVTAVENGQEAIEVIKKKDMDVVILDLRLPGIQGLQILKIMKNVDSALPVIIISGVGTVTAVVDGFRNGAYDFFDKPFNLRELKDSIHRAISDNAGERGAPRQLLSVDMEMFIQDALDETLRHGVPLNNALQSFRERYVDFVERKVLGSCTHGCKH